MIKVFGIGLFLLVSVGGIAQNYSSIKNGQWTDPTVWDGGVVPSAANSDVITVKHIVNIPTTKSATIDGVTVNTGATLQVDAGGTLVVSNVVDALVVQGTLIAQNTSAITNTNGTNVRFAAGGLYRHQFTTTQGVIPLSTWDPTSTTQIEGYTNFASTTAAGNWGQDFGNFVWNCAAQTATCNINGRIISAANNFTVSSTGSGTLQLSQAEIPHIIVGGDLKISGTSKVNFATTGIGTIVDIAGDFVYTSTNATGTSLNTTGQTTLNVSGNFFMDASGGFLYFSKGTDGIGTLNLAGDFTLNNGTMSETGANSAGVSRGVIDFNGNGVQQYTMVVKAAPATTITNTFYYRVDVTSTLNVVGESCLRSSSGGVLNMNGTIEVASANSTGAIVTGTTLGNIRLTTRNFASGSTITYSGSALQTVGNGHPSTAGVNMEVANSAGVVLNNTITTGSTLANLNIGGDLILTSGDLSINTVGRNQTRILTINGNIIDNGNHITFSGNNSDLVINGTGAIGTFPFSAGSQTLQNFTFNRISSNIDFTPTLSILGTAAINTGDVTFNGTTTTLRTLTLASGTTVDFNGTGSITGSATLGSLTLNSGSTLFFEDQSLSVANLTTGSVYSGSFSSNSSSTLTLTGTNRYPTIQFSPSGNTLGTLILNIVASGAPDLILNSDLTVTNSISLTAGTFQNTFGLAMGNGATFNRSGGAFSTVTPSVVPTGGPYNLVYTGISKSTGIEALGSITDLTCSMNSGQTLSGGNAVLNFGGQFIINSGVFSTSTATNITAATFINSSTGTYRGGTSNFTVTGDLTNDGIFNANTGTMTFNGTTNLLGATVPIFYNIVISGTLNGTADFGLSGNFTNNGVFNGGTGTVTFTGGITQNIQGTSPSTFNNITLSGANTIVQVQSNQSIQGVLKLTGNPNTFDADGSANTSVFTLLSTNDNPTVDASIATLGAGALVTGSLTVQRYMSIEGASNGRIYRYISSPVQGAPVSDIQNEIPVTGPFTGNDNLTCSGCNANSKQSMFGYNEAVAGGQDLGYVNFPAAINTETFQQGVGYTIYVRGDILSSPVWDLRGTLNQGSIPLPVSFTSTSGGAANDGWNLVGNPYPSTIDWDAASWTKGGLDGSIYIRDNGQINPVFATWNGVTGTNGGSQYIAMGQGFWVKASSSSPTLVANENVKVAGSSTSFIRQAAPENMLRVTMRSGINRDEAVIHLRADATEDFDGFADAWKLANATINLSSVMSNGQKLAINSLPLSNCPKGVKLDVTAAVGTYKLEFSQFDSFASDVQLSLVDNFTNKTIDIRTTSSYDFQITKDVLSHGSDRFLIAIGCLPVVPPSLVTAAENDLYSSIKVYPSPVKDDLFVEYAVDLSVQSVKMFSNFGVELGDLKCEARNGINRGRFDMRNLSSGIYIVRFFQKGKWYNVKVTKK